MLLGLNCLFPLDLRGLNVFEPIARLLIDDHRVDEEGDVDYDHKAHHSQETDLESV